MKDETETLRQQMFNIKMNLERISKSNILKEEEKKQRSEMIKSLTEEYQKVKKQIAKIKFEERKNANEKYKR